MGQLDFNYGHNVERPNYRTHDPPTYAWSDYEYQPRQPDECIGMLVCPHCGRAAICCDVPLDKSATPTQEDAVMDMNAHYDKDAKSGGGKFKRRPFIKSKDVAANGSTAKILDFREAPKAMEYSDFLMDITIGKKEFTWGLRSKSVTLNMLIDELGKRTEKWIGKSIKLVRAGAKGQYINLG